MVQHVLNIHFGVCPCEHGIPLQILFSTVIDSRAMLRVFLSVLAADTAGVS